MKKLLLLLLSLILCLPSACAESYTFEAPYGITYNLVPFQSELPEKLDDAMAQSAFAGDEVIRGVLVEAYGSQAMVEQYALTAVRHQGQPMLIGFTEKGDDLICRAVSESLLRDGQDFAISVTMPEQGNKLYITVEYGGERFALVPNDMGLWFLQSYTDGEMTIDVDDGELRVSVRGVEQACYLCYTSFLAEDIDGDSFPTTMEAVQAFAAAHLNPIAEGQAASSGANFRVEPTVHSDTMGMVESGVLMTVLGRAQADNSWVHVRIGDTEGYMSSRYVDEGYMAPDFMMPPLPVGRVVSDAVLKRSAGGEAIGNLADGTVVTVLSQSEDGWLHVLLPENESAWPMDLDGQYGWVQVDQVQLGQTRLQLACE